MQNDTYPNQLHSTKHNQSDVFKPMKLGHQSMSDPIVISINDNSGVA